MTNTSTTDELEHYNIRKGLIVTPQGQGVDPTRKTTYHSIGRRGEAHVESAFPAVLRPLSPGAASSSGLGSAGNVWLVRARQRGCPRRHTPPASSSRRRTKAPLEGGGAWEPVSLRHGMRFTRLGRRETEKAQKTWEHLKSPCSHVLPTLAPFSWAVRPA